MKHSTLVFAVVGAALVAGCGTAGSEPATAARPSFQPSTHYPSTGPNEDGVRWPIPRLGDSVVAAMNRMPQRLGTWDQVDASRGMVFYEHPGGRLGIEGSDLEDLFVDDVDAAEAIERLEADFDPGSVRSCSRPPHRCLLGESQGQTAMVWSHDRSKVLLVAVWPDDESRDLLAEAWAEAQS